MDSSLFSKHPGREKPEDATEVGLTPELLHPTGNVKKNAPWESLIAEIIDDVADGSSIDVMRFDTFQEGE